MARLRDALAYLVIPALPIALGVGMLLGLLLPKRIQRRIGL